MELGPVDGQDDSPEYCLSVLCVSVPCDGRHIINRALVVMGRGNIFDNQPYLLFNHLSFPEFSFVTQTH